MIFFKNEEHRRKKNCIPQFFHLNNQIHLIIIRQKRTNEKFFNIFNQPRILIEYKKRNFPFLPSPSPLTPPLYRHPCFGHPVHTRRLERETLPVISGWIARMRGKNGSRDWGKNIEPFLASLTRLKAFSRFAGQRLDLLVRGNELARAYTYTLKKGIPVALCITELLYSQVHRRCA